MSAPLLIASAIRRKTLQIPRCRLTSVLNVPRVLTLLMLVSALSAEGAEHQPRLGIPQDWTHSHLIFTRQVLSTHPSLANAEPRVLQQFLRRAQPYFSTSNPLAAGDQQGRPTIELKRDWSLGLGTGNVAFGMSPIKYGFDVNAPPDCTNDYAAFGLDVAGVTGGQANFVGLNMLYSGPGGFCGTGNPNLLFAYNTTTIAGGRIITSPVVSVDGTKIAFVESATGAAIFHVLTWDGGPGNGVSPTNSAQPGVGNLASMTSLTYASTTDTRSSPWVDYAADEAYVGADDGKLYKITGVFKGTPTLAGSPWPVTVSANRRLTAPVLDHVTRNIFMGDAEGFLWSVNVDNPALTASLAVGLSGAPHTGIVDGPLVDSGNGTVFAVSSNDGVSAVVVQADTSSLAELQRGRIGEGSTMGTNVSIYDGAFNNNYFNAPGTGGLFLCGTGATDATPWRYFFGFSGRILNASASSSAQLLTSTNARCSPVTEFFNKNIGATGTDFFFWSLTADCTGTGSSGCVISRNNFDVVTTADQPGGASAIIVDNNSIAGQASSIYFTDQADPKGAVKLTQNGLN
jgi:hypothetical protein